MMFPLMRLLITFALLRISCGSAIGPEQCAGRTTTVHVTHHQESTVTVTSIALPAYTTPSAETSLSQTNVDNPPSNPDKASQFMTTAKGATYSQETVATPNNVGIVEYKTLTVTTTVTTTVTATTAIQVQPAKVPIEAPSSSSLSITTVTMSLSNPSAFPKIPGGFNWNQTGETSTARSPYLTSYIYSLISANGTLQAGTSTSSPISSEASYFGPESATTSTITSFAGSSKPPEHCGLWGNFTLNWDDEPLYIPGKEDEGLPLYPPIFNPYHKLFFTNGYGYAPLPPVMYTPSSPPYLALFLPNGTTKDIGSPYAAGDRPGEIGAGPRASLTAFWFNVYSLELGCENAGPDACHIEIKGFEYRNATKTETLAAKQRFEIPACPSMNNCKLTQVQLTDGFKGLSGITIIGRKNGFPIAVFMDDLRMAWYDDSCEAGLLRIRERK